MNTLIATGAGAAFLYSLVATVAPRLVKTDAHIAMPGMQDAPTAPVYFEAASVILALILLGRLLEARARGKTSAASKRLLGLQARTARVVRGDKEADIPIAEVVVGDEIIVRPGEKIPVDGVVRAGASAVNEAMRSATASTTRPCWRRPTSRSYAAG
jgi:Cu+-exporting ATPase